MGSQSEDLATGYTTMLCMCLARHVACHLLRLLAGRTPTSTKGSRLLYHLCCSVLHVQHHHVGTRSGHTQPQQNEWASTRHVGLVVQSEQTSHAFPERGSLCIDMQTAELVSRLLHYRGRCRAHHNIHLQRCLLPFLVKETTAKIDGYQRPRSI